MKTSIQMNVAKHMIAVWMDVNEEDSLKDAFDTINRCWPGLPRRVLRVWAKELHKNPERYEFTGYAFMHLKMEDHFEQSEIEAIDGVVRQFAGGALYDDVIRSIIHHKWVYGMDTFTSVQHGISAFEPDRVKGVPNRRYRPAKPVLKPCK